jgi:predicted nucleic acid-binding Zn ribbon protein
MALDLPTEAHCVFCHQLMTKQRSDKLYCSGRCRAKASFERRVAAAVEARLQRFVRRGDNQPDVE